MRCKGVASQHWCAGKRRIGHEKDSQTRHRISLLRGFADSFSSLCAKQNARNKSRLSSRRVGELLLGFVPLGFIRKARPEDRTDLYPGRADGYPGSALRRFVATTARRIYGGGCMGARRQGIAVYRRGRQPAGLCFGGASFDQASRRSQREKNRG